MIGMVKQDSPTQVKVYDEKGTFMFNREGILVGYTATSLSLKSPYSESVSVYNEKGTFQYNR